MCVCVCVCECVSCTDTKAFSRSALVTGATAVPHFGTLMHFSYTHMLRTHARKRPCGNLVSLCI